MSKTVIKFLCDNGLLHANIAFLGPSSYYLYSKVNKLPHGKLLFIKHPTQSLVDNIHKENFVTVSASGEERGEREESKSISDELSILSFSNTNSNKLLPNFNIHDKINDCKVTQSKIKGLIYTLTGNSCPFDHCHHHYHTTNITILPKINKHLVSNIKWYNSQVYIYLNTHKQHQ
jgi:hypothetical protein